ncbi:glucokinase [Antarcticibacterium flavum]|uniref:Glucokinase n=1 Tax=Antarcticibacterium flavum TaxID=2058175 RepID=A0A5B7WY90_9FLAO|nr:MULTISPECIES: glucokinase [Antarcticibacterium]MCM4160853.1 glucokinase [Antarcticibacterium sp. W02-3]QCY68020.1 glucokinase [Antarcticibacterium flavum]
MSRPIKIRIDSNNDSYLPFLENVESFSGARGTILAGDVGGTKTNLSLYSLEEGVLHSLYQETFITREYSSFSQMLQNLEIKDLPKVDSMCLGVAGPVVGGKVEGTNFPWVLEQEKLRQELNLPLVSLINDMEANAYGLAILEDKDFRTIKEGSGIAGNAALISPGTGLGEAGLYWNGMTYQPFATEGGHCDFAARNQLDIYFLKFLQKGFGHVSWERIISGPGIYNIYRFLKEHRSVDEPRWFSELLKDKDPAAVISECAAADNYAVCTEVMELFQKYLAVETAQVALKFKTTGGIYLGGGILPKIIDNFKPEIFIEDFQQMNRMNPLLETMKIQVILNENSPMYGAAFYAARELVNSRRAKG